VYVFKEMKYDSGIDNVYYDFIRIPESTGMDAYPVGTNIIITDEAFYGPYKIMSIYSAASYATFRVAGNISLNTNGDIIDAVTNAIILKRYDGNGFGDDNKFNIVDNVSTVVDDNGSTVLVGQKARLIDGRIKE